MADLLRRGFGPGFNGPLPLVARGNENRTAGALLPVRTAVAADPDVAFVSPPIPSPDGKVAMLVTYPKSSPQAQATQDLVRRLRTDVLPSPSKSSGVQVFVGGSTGASVDATAYTADRLGLFIGAVVVLSFLLLLVVFRSLLVPLKAAIMNLLSIGAAYGVVAMVVQGGWLGGLVGIHDPVPIPSFIPMMMFAILFGLSMDDEVFLLSRIREGYTRTDDNATAVADGLAHTARVITAAAAIMISVFLAFVLADQVFLKMMGVGLATAIFVDATIVRMILVPRPWNCWVTPTGGYRVGSTVGWITHTDLSSTDPAATRQWCEAVLGWTFQPVFPTPSGTTGARVAVPVPMNFRRRSSSIFIPATPATRWCRGHR